MKLTIGNGITNYIADLERLSNATDRIIAEAVHEGAAIVADAIRTNIDAIPTDDRPYVDGMRTGLKTIQKKALQASFGIAPMRNDNGYVNVKAGFDGYNKLRTKKYPRGQPNAMIARSIESGTSFMQKHPFVSTAVRASKDRAEAAMAKIIDEQSANNMKG